MWTLRAGPLGGADRRDTFSIVEASVDVDVFAVRRVDHSNGVPRHLPQRLLEVSPKSHSSVVIDLTPVDNLPLQRFAESECSAILGDSEVTDLCLLERKGSPLFHGGSGRYRLRRLRCNRVHHRQEVADNHAQEDGTNKGDVASPPLTRINNDNVFHLVLLRKLIKTGETACN